MLKTYILILCFSLCYNIHAQQITEVRKLFYTSEKGRLSNAEILRNYYLDESPDSIYSIGSFLIRKGLEKENFSLLNYGKLIISSYYYEHGKAEISIENLEDCVLFYERKRDLEKLADAQNMMGLALMYQSKNKEAISWFLKSLKTARQLPEESEMYMAQINMVEAFYRLDQLESAEKELDAFLIKVKKLNLNKALRKSYQLKAKLCFATNRIQEGLEYSKKSLQLAFENGDKLGLSFAKNDMAIAFFQSGDENSARLAFEASLALRKELGNAPMICESYFNLGEYHYSKENYSKAILYYDSSLHWAEKNKLLSEEIDALERIGECYSKSDQAQLAYQYMADFALKQKDLIRVLKKDEALLNGDLKEFRQDEQQLNQTIRERTLQKRVDAAEFNSRLMLAITIVIFILSGFFAWRSKNKARI